MSAKMSKIPLESLKVFGCKNAFDEFLSKPIDILTVDNFAVDYLNVHNLAVDF